MRNAKRAIAIASIAISGAVVALTSPAHANATASSASVTAMGWKYHGYYPDLGTCNYWRYAVKAAGGDVGSCWDTGSSNWVFAEWV
ncbi:hypothetical protein E1286_40645 [Nonomuraea terrae]|uniref:Secreted protein n=1 Tax=Nonomuraea terrae TaxID=2530383 RepID=A0A4R4XTI0_9ACTN|nr:hypothetical protein [Nonomuraea terrae]TDD34613.1 hypothetical protein E1286_40645 [Nonomuraea terrae]